MIKNVVNTGLVNVCDQAYGGGNGPTLSPQLPQLRDEIMMAFEPKKIEEPKIEIPKVFHRIWLGGKPMPESFEQWGQSWLKFNPEWKLKTWTEENLTTRYPELIARCCHLSQRSNIHRYEILEREGGVYIDTDFECFRGIDPLLDHVSAFGSYKKGTNRMLSAILGATPHHPWIQSLVADLPSCEPTVSYSMGSLYVTNHVRGRTDVKVFDEEIFCPISNHETHLANKRYPKAYGMHHWTAVTHPTGFEPLEIPKANLLIPRTFHRIWLGKKPMPEMYEQWGKTWTSLNPGWEMKTWTEKNLISRYPEILARCCHLSQQSNIHRYEILEREGGIYVDTDFECLKPIEELLDNVEAFAGYKRTAKHVMAGILGTTPHHPWMKELVDDIPTADPMVNMSLGSYYVHNHTMKHPEVRCFPATIFCPITTKELDKANDPHPGAYAIHYWGSIIYPEGFKPLERP